MEITLQGAIRRLELYIADGLGYAGMMDDIALVVAAAKKLRYYGMGSEARRANANAEYQSVMLDKNTTRTAEMSKTNNGGPAFPREDYQADDSPGQIGMTLRDYFAAKAMASLVVAHSDEYSDEHELAKDAYEMADAMIAARETK